MAIFGVGLCLPVLFACVVSTSVVQGRNLRRRHSHHSHADYNPNFEQSIPHDLSKRLEDDLQYQHDPYRKQMERRQSFRVLDYPAEYEERVPPLRRYKHMYDMRNYESLRRKDETYRPEDYIEDASRFALVRGKRHNRFGGMSYQNLNDQNGWVLEMSMQRKQQHELHTSTSSDLRTSFELEVKEAQNSSICSYTVESIPDTRGTRMPKDLEHIKCNDVGSSCQADTSAYCCIQTYRYVEVSYDDGEDSEKMKIYVGCVCALQELNNGLSTVQSKLRIHD
ncbi:uncharacterized protein [Anoplolepis gracilipes]|uniref:uncharacterized protein n=1 Tax=Anoplolepis gracilipes TaxID=354296 RepID=UPI003BA13DC0